MCENICIYVLGSADGMLHFEGMVLQDHRGLFFDLLQNEKRHKIRSQNENSDLEKNWYLKSQFTSRR